MYHYMAALHQRFFQAPDFTQLEEELSKPARKCGTTLGSRNGES